MKGVTLTFFHKLRAHLADFGERLQTKTGKRFHLGLLIVSFLGFGASLYHVHAYVVERERIAFLYANRDSYVLVQTYKEIERLIDALGAYVFRDPSEGASRAEMMLRFELLVSRVPLLSEGEIGKRLSAIPGVSQVAQELNDSLGGMEQMLEQLEEGDSPNYQAIRWELQRHRDTLFALSRNLLLSSEPRGEVTPTASEQALAVWQFVPLVLTGSVLVLLSIRRFRGYPTPPVKPRPRELRQFAKTNKDLSYQATHDTLTGLLNRSELERRLQRVYLSAQTQGDEGALLFLDLDRFKVINDSCGHLAGDQLLRQIGALLRGRVRKRDTLARFGGDQFVALLEHCPLPKALRVTEDILEAVREFRFIWKGRTFSMGISIGVAPVTIGSESPEAVLIAADRVCYEAKSAGRNCVRVYAGHLPVSRWDNNQIRWLKRIKQGLANNHFRLFSQSIRPLKPTQGENWRRDYYEIFLRLEDEEGGLTEPEAFFSTAERYNLMPALDRWVIRRTFDWLCNNPRYLESLGVCFINLSADTVIDAKFRDFIRSLLKHTHLPAHKFCFEVAEETAMANLGAAIDLIQFLNKMGCYFALDDFGSGMSTFSYLKLLPVDFIKIDGGLVKDIAGDSVDRTLVHAINEVSQAMGKRTIAKYVETKAVLDELRPIGVDFMQGYAVAEPRPLEHRRVSPALVVS